MDTTIGFKEYCYRFRWAFCGIALIIFITYGSLMTNYYITVDDDVHWRLVSHQAIKEGYLSDGRFGQYILNIITRTMKPIPFWAICIAALALGFFCVLLGYYYYNNGQKDTFSFLLVSALFISSTEHIYYMAFTYMSLTIALGYIWILLSLIAVDKWVSHNVFCLWKFITAIALLLLSISTYSSFIPVFFLMACVLQIPNFINNNISFFLAVKMVIKYITVFLGSAVCYFIINLFLPSRTYLNNYIGWSRGSISDVIKTITSFVLDTLQGHTLRYGWVIGISIPIAFIVMIINLIQKRKWNTFHLLIPIMIIFAFSFNLVLGNYLHMRSMQTMPLLVMGIWCYILLCLTKFPIVNKIICITCVLAIMVQTQGVNELTYTGIMRGKHDESLINNITERIGSLTGKDIGESKVLFLGERNIVIDGDVRVNAETLGYSLFSQSPNEQFRIYNLIHHYYGAAITTPGGEPRTNGMRYGLTMPSWPHKNSVQMYEDFVIVKLSSYVPANLMVRINSTPLTNINIDSVDTSQQLIYSIDSIQEIESSGPNLQIKGFAFDSVNMEPLSRLYIQIGDFVYYCIKDHLRSDVSNHYKNTDLKPCGIETIIPYDTLPVGSHVLKLLWHNEESPELFETVTDITIHRSKNGSVTFESISLL